MVTPIAAKIYQKVQILPNNLQHQVLSFVRTLETLTQTGTSGKSLLQFAGAIPLNDVEEMCTAIESDCGQVDIDEW